MKKMTRLLSVSLLLAFCFPTVSSADKSDFVSTDGIDYRRLGTKDKEKQKQIKEARRLEKTKKEDVRAPSGETSEKHGKHRH